MTTTAEQPAATADAAETGPSPAERSPSENTAIVPGTRRVPAVPPRGPRLLAVATAGVLTLGSLAAAAVAGFIAESTLWASLGFCLLGAFAGVLGVLMGLGRFAAGFGIGCLCLGGSAFVATAFATLDFRANLGGQPGLARLVLPWVGLQAIASAGLIAAGGAAVLARRRGAWGTLIKGALLLLPAVGVIALGPVVLNMLPAGESGRVAGLGALLVGGAVFITFAALGGHHLIRAFEITTED